MKRIVYAAIILLLVGCGRMTTGVKPVVAVSIAPLRWVVENIADTLVDVVVVVPDAVGAENYDPTARQVARLNQADIYFKIGLLDFEKDLSDANSVNLCDDVEIIGERDPHIWLSVKNMRSVAKRVHDEFLKLYPAFSKEMDARFTILDSVLNDMDLRFSQLISGKENVLIVHPSLSYLAKDYGFSQIAVEEEGKEPSASDLKEIFDMIPQRGIKTIYYSKQDNPQEAMAIASEAGIEAVEYDPLSGNWKQELEMLIGDICEN